MPVANVKSKWVDGNLVFEDDSGNELLKLDAANTRITDPNALYQVRKRFTIAEVNAGAELLPAVDGYKYRMVNCKAIAVGGAVGATTTVDVLGTQSSSGVKLVTFAQADMTQSTVLSDSADGTVLADGASYVACDDNTAITVGQTGSDITTATHVDFIFEYALEAA